MHAKLQATIALIVETPVSKILGTTFYSEGTIERQQEEKLGVAGRGIHSHREALHRLQ